MMDANAPYLPPLEPTDNAPLKKHVRRTIFLWLLLMLMFVSIYQFFGTPETHHHVAHAPPRDDWNPISSLLPALVALGVFYWLIRRQLATGARLSAKLEPGQQALADGDLGRAVETFAAVARQYKRQPACAAMAKLQLKKALDAAAEAERAPGLLFRSEVRLHAATDLALLYALSGDSHAATRWCEDGRRRLASAGQRALCAALLRQAEIVVVARTGQNGDAARAFDRDWRRLEEVLPAAWMRISWVVRCFVAAGDGTRGSVEPWLTMARSGRKGELRWMAAEWPELAAFLDAHDL
jgi:hypothetical protein